MPYQPTGKPPGRPPKAKPAAPKAAEQPLAKMHPGSNQDLKPPAPGRETALHMADGRLCATCWPDGWPGTAVALGCPHGGPYIRRL